MNDERRPKKPGRPRLDPDDESVNVHFRLPAKHYDATFAEATRARVSLADYIRRRLRGNREADK